MHKFRKSVRPVYGTTDKKRPDHLASCILAEFQGEAYLITAAHVVDHASVTTLHIGAKELVPVSGEFKVTEAEKAREHDKFDFAFLRLTEEQRLSFADCTLLDLSEIAEANDYEESSVYAAIGFPNTKNRKVDNVAKTVQPTLWSFTNYAGTRDLLAPDWPQSGEGHVFLKYGKYLRDASGQKVPAVKPVGMSGGLLASLGNLASVEVIAGDRSPTPKAAGLLIEGSARSGRMVATKLHIVRDAIRRS